MNEEEENNNNININNKYYYKQNKEKPKILKKPIPKPRRRINNYIEEEEKQQNNNLNNLSPQLSKKILKLKNQQKIIIKEDLINKLTKLNLKNIEETKKLKIENNKKEENINGKKVSPSQLFFNCPRASPEATGSSLNSPTSPSLLSTNFVQNWQNVEEEKEENKKIKEDFLLKELVEEGDNSSLLIASWLDCSSSTSFNYNNNELEIIENQRPPFSLDRLVPPELQLEIKKPIENNEKKIYGEFSLQKSSVSGQCQGIVFVHFHQENNFLKIKIEKEENKKKKIFLLKNNNAVPYKEQKIEKEKINKNNSLYSSSSCSLSLRSNITLIEQIVKSHPIWFLPHLDRQAASHLLRNQETGVFIVRGSSRIIINNSSFNNNNCSSPISVMALSVKLNSLKFEENKEENNNEDIEEEEQLDHFLLEAVGSGQSVRLQGSPRTFSSLPLLLEYYSQPEAIQELKCNLCLPNAITKCESINALQGLALMGQDFWTSPLAFQNVQITKLLNNNNNNNDYNYYSTNNSQQCNSSSSSLKSGLLPTIPIIPTLIHPKMGTFITQQQTTYNNQNNNNNYHFFYCQSPCPSITSTTASAPPFQTSSSLFNNNNNKLINNNNNCCCYNNNCFGYKQQIIIKQNKQFALPLRKSRSVQSSFLSNNNPLEQQKQYSSNKTFLFCQSPNTQSLRESNNYEQRFAQKKRGTESFLRSLFSPSPQRRKQKGEGRNDGSSWEWMPSPANSPLWEEELPNNNINYSINSSSQKQFLKTNSQLKKQQSCSIFARLKGNFRRTSSSGISPSIKDNWQENNKINNEILNVRQSAFRRTNTDLGNSSNNNNRITTALNKIKKQQLINNNNIPQLARVLPQPRITKTNLNNNSNNNNKNNIFITPSFSNNSPANIKKQNQVINKNIKQHLNNNFNKSLNNSTNFSHRFCANNKNQAVIAAVRPQPKMVLINSSNKLQIKETEKEEKEEDEENNKNNNLSEYTYLNELFKLEPSTSTENDNNNYFKKGSDEVSIAGTDFNEPWDSNAWENLLEITKFADAKTEIPILSQRQRRRHSSSCGSSSISSNGSTWKLNSSPDDDNDEYNNIKINKKIKSKKKEEEEDINVAEEAVAMAVVLAGNGTLPNRKKSRPMKWLCEEEENEKLEENKEEEEKERDDKINMNNNINKIQQQQNTSLDTLILIEQAAKAANYSRCNISQKVRWTRNCREVSTSLIDIPSSSSFSTIQKDQQNIKQLNDKFPVDSMDEFIVESGGGRHRRSERRIQAMMEKSIGEQHIHHTHQTAFHSVTGYSTSIDELGSQHSRTGSICPSITPVLSPSRLRNTSNDSQGEKDPALVIQQYVETLSTDDQTVFGATLQRFIECTLLSREQDPYIVVRRVRQFLNGIKNYLVKNGESDLHMVIERESDRLHADEFLNIDAILETVLNKILLVKIKAQLYRLMIMENTRNGELGKLTENLSLVRAMNSEELGFSEDTVLPDKTRMESINRQLRKMQNHYSPLKKLQLLLRALALAVPHLPLLSSSELQRQQQQQQQSFIAAQNSNSSVFLSPIAQTSSSLGAGGGRLRSNSGSSSGGAVAAALKHPPADELIRWLVYLLARSSTINCEIEAWYMWELLPQQVLSTGDASYFLSILFSAVHVIKHPEIVKRLKNVSIMPGRHPLPNFPDFLGSQSTLHDNDDFVCNNSDLLLRVAIPNEQEGSIEYHTFPVLPKMNVSKLCRVIAHQFSVSNPEDYGLYVLFDGYETVLSPDEFPHLVRDNMVQSGKTHLFAYKRSETRIAWPKQAFSNFGTTSTLNTEKKKLFVEPKCFNIQQQCQQPSSSSASSSRIVTSSNGEKGRIKTLTKSSSSNNKLTNNNKAILLFNNNLGMHA